MLHTGLLGGRGLTRLVEVVGGGLGRGVRGRVAGGGGRSSVLLDVRHLRYIEYNKRVDCI